MKFGSVFSNLPKDRRTLTSEPSYACQHNKKMTVNDAASVPNWLADVCSRLAENDVLLTNLNFNIRRFKTDTMADELASSLAKNSLIVTLNLTSSFQSVAGKSNFLDSLGRSLECHKSLQVLHLSYNRLPDVAAFGRTLANNQILRVLHFDHNDIDSVSAVALAQGLCLNSALEELYLGSNRICDKGAMALAESLLKNRTLHTLDLNRNKIGMDGALVLLDTIKTSMIVWHVVLEENNIVARVREEAALFCSANRCGRKLLLDHSIPGGMWHLVLGKSSSQVSVLYLLLLSKPDLCKRMPSG